jgi:hypothetical protein
MGKKKQRKASVSKKLAGVRIPKKVRKSRLGALLASPLGQELLAGSAAVAGGAMAGSKLRRNESANRLAGQIKHAGQQGVDDTQAGASVFAYALGEAARSFADALQSKDHLKPDAAGADGDGAPVSKKKPSYVPTPGL